MNIQASEKKQHREIWIDFLRGVTMILVVWGHSSAYNSRLGPYLITFNMSLYFILSGYVSKCDEIDFRRYLKKKAKRMLVPYALWGLALVAINAVKILVSPSPNGLILFNVVGLFYGRYMLFNTESVRDPSNVYLYMAENSTLWFLLAIFLASLLFFWFWRTKKAWARITLIALFVLFSAATSYLPILLPWSIDSIGVFAILMIFGAYLKKCDKDMPLYIAIICGVLYVIAARVNSATNVSVGKWGRFGAFSIVLYVACGIFAILFLMNLSKRFLRIPCFEKCSVIRYINFVGKNSITFLCAQLLLINVADFAFSDIVKNNYVLGMIEIAFVFVILPLLILLFRLIKRKLLSFKKPFANNKIYE